MKHDEYWKRPKKGKVISGKADSWWYANKGGIEIHIDPYSQGHITVKVPRAVLKKYMAKSA